MYYFKDLIIEKTKSKSRAVFGAIAFVFAILYIGIQIITDKIMEPYQWIFSLYFVGFGLVHTLGGMGHPVEHIMGRSFIELNDKDIKVKRFMFKKANITPWDTIQNVSFTKNKILFTLKDNSKTSIPYTIIQYSWLQELKEIIEEHCNDRKIQII